MQLELYMYYYKHSEKISIKNGPVFYLKQSKNEIVFTNYFRYLLSVDLKPSDIEIDSKSMIFE